MNDVISRQDALETFLQYRHSVLSAEEIISLIPSAQERKKGEWVKEDLSDCLTPGGNSIYHCSECDHTEGPWPHPRLSNFCPNCGAEMEKGESDANNNSQN